MKSAEKARRPHTLGVRVSTAEKSEIERIAEATGIGVSGLMRQCFMLGKKQLVQAGIVCAGITKD
jgi:hypothetical protein